MTSSTDPSCESVARPGCAEFSGGDPGIERSRGNMWHQEETIHGIDTAEMRRMMEYVSRASAASNRQD